MNYMYSENTLYHHGIKGQKWGIRRYQNEDGTLTEAGKKRLSKKIKKADSQNKHLTVNQLTSEAVDSYKKTSTSYATAKKAYDTLKDKETRMEKTANDAAAKKVGMTVDEMRKRGREASNVEDIIAMRQEYERYRQEGERVLRDLMSKTDYKKTVSEYKTAYSKAHSDGLSYIKDYMGKYGDMSLNNPTSITYDAKTGKIRKTTVAERMGIELTRDIWIPGR